jgi:hypothetical protein
MKPEIPGTLVDEASQWEDLHRWERKQLGIALRRLGLTYSEIQDIIPVPKGTLSNWCNAIPLSDERHTQVLTRTGPHSRRGTSVDTQWRRRIEISRIRHRATQYFQRHSVDPLFIAGVSLYWAEGSKTRNDLSMTNTDSRLLVTFVHFVRSHLDPNASFALALHLHEGDSESEAKTHWRNSLSLPETRFTKTYFKPSGTGHRKKKLPYGVCRVRIDKASNHWNTVMQWINDTSELLGR